MVDNSLSSHTNDFKNGFLILGERDNFGINGSFGAPQKKPDINFSKKKTKFGFRLHYSSLKSYLFVNGRGIYKFNSSKKNFKFPSQFCLGSICNKFDYADSEEVFLKRNVHNFSVNCDSIDKSHILCIHKYLTSKNNRKECSACLLHN